MRMLLSICDDYANEYHVVFNAKNRNVCSPPHKYRTSVQGPNPIFQVDGHSLEYVNEWPHLGHIVSADLLIKGRPASAKITMVEACCQRAGWWTTRLDDRVTHARTPYQLIWHTLVTDIYNSTARGVSGSPPVSHGPIWWVMRLLCGSMWSQLYWLCV